MKFNILFIMFIIISCLSCLSCFFSKAYAFEDKNYVDADDLKANYNYEIKQKVINQIKERIKNNPKSDEIMQSINECIIKILTDNSIIHERETNLVKNMVSFLLD